MPRFNENDEMDFGLCKCGHAIGDHGDEGECEIRGCGCLEFTEEDNGEYEEGVFA